MIDTSTYLRGEMSRSRIIDKSTHRLIVMSHMRGIHMPTYPRVDKSSYRCIHDAAYLDVDISMNGFVDDTACRLIAKWNNPSIYHLDGATCRVLDKSAYRCVYLSNSLCRDMWDSGAMYRFRNSFVGRGRVPDATEQITPATTATKRLLLA
jgi:hypothetical protein